ncbi:MAG: hypothetical protein JF616_14160 [Fibrobacteres bacterium]|nr:hypothetical protein [Fibrobacterota bacterium]
MKLFRGVALSLALWLPSQADLRDSVSQFGITWVFDKPHETGQFANGDWWVVGPVTAVSVLPAPAGGRNGSMLNPEVGSQAYDSRGGAYDAARQAGFPLQLQPIQSLVSSVSHDTSTCSQGGLPGYPTYNGDCQRGPVRTQAVLTVLASPPPPGTFRPPYAGTAYKPLFTASRICWGLLPKLPVPATAPAAEAVLRHVERPWIDHLDSWELQYSCATGNMFCYGREIADIVSEVSQYVLLGTPSQQALAIRLIQLGIDDFGVVRAGGSWPADGGHMSGRKWPVLFAGLMLDDPAMKKPGSFGGEDGQTYYGAQGKALWGKICQYGYQYFQNGCTGNGSKDCRDPQALVDGCDDYRICCTSHTWVGQALAAHILRAEDDWDHPAFFDYVDRWVAEGGDKGGDFVGSMWDAYRNKLPAPGTCAASSVLRSGKMPTRRHAANPALRGHSCDGRAVLKTGTRP